MLRVVYVFCNKLFNFFYPYWKLFSKERIGVQIRKVYDKPQIPFERDLQEGGYFTSVKGRLSSANRRFDGVWPPPSSQRPP